MREKLFSEMKCCLKSRKYDKHERATAAAAAEESPGRVQPPSHHAQGFNIPFGHTPHSDNSEYIYIYMSFDLGFQGFRTPRIDPSRQVSMDKHRGNMLELRAY